MNTEYHFRSDNLYNFNLIAAIVNPKTCQQLSISTAHSRHTPPQSLHGSLQTVRARLWWSLQQKEEEEGKKTNQYIQTNSICGYLRCHFRSRWIQLFINKEVQSNGKTLLPSQNRLRKSSILLLFCRFVIGQRLLNIASSFSECLWKVNLRQSK